MILVNNNSKKKAMQKYLIGVLEALNLNIRTNVALAYNKCI